MKTPMKKLIVAAVALTSFGLGTDTAEAAVPSLGSDAINGLCRGNMASGNLNGPIFEWMEEQALAGGFGGIPEWCLYNWQA